MYLQINSHASNKVINKRPIFANYQGFIFVFKSFFFKLN